MVSDVPIPITNWLFNSNCTVIDPKSDDRHALFNEDRNVVLYQILENTCLSLEKVSGNIRTISNTGTFKHVIGMTHSVIKHNMMSLGASRMKLTSNFLYPLRMLDLLWNLPMPNFRLVTEVILELLYND